MSEDNNKYEKLEKELEEYKKLLWQLSDEYKINVSAAENKLEEEIIIRKNLEDKLKSTLKTEEEIITNEKQSDFSFISSLGLPACIIDSKGKINKFNNKFKFLIELLFLEIEEIDTIQKLAKQDKTQNLNTEIDKYFSEDDRLFQCLFKVENSFQNKINLIFRIYNYDKENHIVFLLELNKHEIDSLFTNKNSNTEIEIHKPTTQETSNSLSNKIRNLSDKYEIETELLSKIKKTKNPEIKEIISNSFNLKKERQNILTEIKSNKTAFIAKLSNKYPELTSNEVKQCILIKESLTYKEIAAIMNISINGVKIARNRLRKKINLKKETKTQDFINNI